SVPLSLPSCTPTYLRPVGFPPTPLLPSAGNFLLTNPVPGGGTILTGMTLQQAGRQPGVLSNFPQEGLVLSPLPQPAAWPGSAGMEMQAAGTEGLFEMEKGAVEVLDGTEPSGLLLPEGEGLLLGSSASDPLDPEGLDSDEKVLTQLQSVPVEEPLDL
uniref:Uncharacterized protein n=1 Tax=Terrapene triunguis TaxID=2587831 RepID=A0A674IT47_9SAUR